MFTKFIRGDRIMKLPGVTIFENLLGKEIFPLLISEEFWRQTVASIPPTELSFGRPRNGMAPCIDICVYV